jgi:hypothetical protein
MRIYGSLLFSGLLLAGLSAYCPKAEAITPNSVDQIGGSHNIFTAELDNDEHRGSGRLGAGS